MKIAWATICLMLAFYQSGCAATAFLRADKSVLGSFDTNARLYIEAKDSMSVEEGNFMVLLIEQIKGSGLKTETDKAEAEYVLKFSITNIILLGQEVHYQPVLNTGFHAGEQDIFYYPISSWYGDYGVKIEIAIYKKQDSVKSPRIPVWQASVVAKRETYRSQGTALISSMLRYIGQSYEGSIQITKNE